MSTASVEVPPILITGISTDNLKSTALRLAEENKRMTNKYMKGTHFISNQTAENINKEPFPTRQIGKNFKV